MSTSPSNRLRRVLFSVLGCISLASCSSLNTPRTHTQTPKDTNHSTPSTTRLLVNPQATESPVPLPTLTPTIIPSLTPLPYIGFSVLYEETVGCQLPCIWGIVPGDTSIARARQILESYGAYLDDEYLAFYPTFNPGDDSNWTAFEVDGPIVSEIHMGPETAIHQYQVSDLLSNYGAPDNVFFQKLRKFGSDWTYLIVSYAEESFIAVYSLHHAGNSNQNAFCLEPWDGPHIIAWASGKNWSEVKTIQQFLPSGFGVEISEIESGMTSESFYQQFRDSSNQLCLTLD